MNTGFIKNLKTSLNKKLIIYKRFLSFMKPIIYAEDDSDRQKSLKLALEGRIPGVCVETVWDGDALVEKVLKNDYGLIITDQNMGSRHKTGLDAAKVIRESGRQTPIYLFTDAVLAENVITASGITRFFDRLHRNEILEAAARVYAAMDLNKS